MSAAPSRYRGAGSDDGVAGEEVLVLNQDREQGLVAGVLPSSDPHTADRRQQNDSKIYMKC